MPTSNDTDELSHTTDESTVVTLSSPKDASEPYSPPTSSSSAPHTGNASLPSTPPRGRSRYPSELARVPLHRRGTSDTYERLEDLLREAGYKETRVFTPEPERLTNLASDKNANRMRGGVGAVVGFLAGLVSRNSSLAREAKSQGNPAPPAPPEDAQEEWSQPPSPLAQVHQINGLHASSSTSLSTSGYSFDASPGSLRKHSRFHPTPNGSTRSQPRKALAEENGEDSHTQHHTIHQSRSSRALPHQPHLRHYMHNKTSLNSEAPKAHAYLRHMASAPNIQPLVKRPPSNVSLRSHRPPYRHAHSSRRAVLLSDDIVETEDVSQPPPLPLNWMESVAKALLSGVPSDASSTRTARKPSSALTEATNMPREPRRPPLLCAQVREQRARRSEGTVSRTNVVCRSAPASRAGSRVRRSAEEDKGSRNRRDDKGRRKGKQEEEARKGKGKGKGRELDLVPSLARTRVENDEWGMRRYLDPTCHDDVRQEVSSDDDLDDDAEEEEEEGELDLERLLVPARRQASIRSLRKHLHAANATGSLRGARAASPSSNGRLSPFAPARPRDWPDDSWGRGRGRRWLVGEEDDDEGDGYGNGAFSSSEMGTGTRAGMKRRRGLPGAWAQWGS
ncbi:hypothetical protein K503DRAFT_770570 [Rhizopogon vinicolor AM-OR11-026]|uniref:Uncharacterized protein n=1 Tax=Rhizopogon vinicolor AM-OR11-026 TaxID=1314800 RepID=A0A1B7N0L6_9AGAM|nr:hypothetical protein K503DRAFT_770570 [Rhizopogon vinicolor AM-OR11-026]